MTQHSTLTLVSFAAQKSLGVMLVPALMLEMHVSLEEACHVSAEKAVMIHAKVTVRLNYCNKLYTGLPLKIIQKIQLVQNVAACLLSVAGFRENIMLVLICLHLVLVSISSSRCQFLPLKHQSPTCLKELISHCVHQGLWAVLSLAWESSTAAWTPRS